MNQWIDDLRRALRALRSSPASSVFVVTVMAVAVAAALAILGLADAVLWRGLRVAEPERLVRLLASDERHEDVWSSTSYPVFADYRDGARTLEAVAAYEDDAAVHLRWAATPLAEPGRAGLASGRFFEILGTRAASGRLFGDADDRPGAAPVAVLDPRFERRSGLAPGDRLTINGHGVEVIGVLPDDFVGAELGTAPDLWVPIAHANLVMPAWANFGPLESRRFGWVRTVARLAPGSTVAAAQAELDALAASRARQQKAGEEDPFAKVVRADEIALGLDSEAEVRRLTWLLASAAVVLLLAAAANASAVLLAQGERRLREAALARALGAPTARVVRPAMLEGALLSAAGVGAGWVLAPGALGLLRRVGDGVPLPLWAATDLDQPRFLAIAGIVLAAVTILSSLAPAIRQARISTRDGLTMASRSTTAARSRASVRDALVTVQAALAAILLLASGLLLRSIAGLEAVDLGFEPRGVAVGILDLAPAGYDRVRTAGFATLLLDDLERIPGVESAALGSAMPLHASGMRMTVRPEGHVARPDEDMGVAATSISDAYFDTLGVRFVAGRPFDDRRDVAGAPRVMIVNRAFVERFWPGADSVLGRTVGDIGLDGESAEVVGVVETFKRRGPREAATPMFFLPLGQFPTTRVSIAARGSRPEAELVEVLRQAVARLDPALPLAEARPFSARLDAALTTERALLFCFGAFAATVVLLVGAGLYGLLAVVVERRRREIGVRRALGARGRDVFGGILRRGLVLCGFGGALGVAVALLAGRGLGSLLFGVRPWDPPALLAALGLLAVVAGGAALVPAWRAARLDPLEALRSE